MSPHSCLGRVIGSGGMWLSVVDPEPDESGFGSKLYHFIAAGYTFLFYSSVSSFIKWGGGSD